MSDNPFASPGTIGPNQPPKTDGLFHLRPLKGRLMAAKIGVALYCLTTIVVLILNTIGTLKYASFSDPLADLTDQTEQVLVLSMSGAAIIGALAYLVTAIATCMFMYRSNGNAKAMGATEMEFTPGWSVGVWFIPILNLFRPYQAMKEIQMASSNPEGSQWKNAEPLALFAPWWAYWIVGGIASRVINRLELKGMDLGMFGVLGHWFAGLLLIAGGVLLIGIMQEIANLQFSEEEPAIEDVSARIG